MFFFILVFAGRVCSAALLAMSRDALHCTASRNKLKGATAMLNMFSGGGSKASTAEEDADFEEDKDRLRDFQFKMLELQVSCGKAMTV